MGIIIEGKVLILVPGLQSHDAKVDKIQINILYLFVRLPATNITIADKFQSK